MTVEAASTPRQPAHTHSRCQLSYAEFEAQCRHLCSVLPHTLSWHPCPSPFHSDGGYMVASNQLLTLSASPPIFSPLPDDDEDEEQPLFSPIDGDEDSAGSAAPDTRPIFASYHVTYSSTYRVPALLFRLSFADGQPLSMEETLATLQRRTDPRSRSLTRQCETSEEEGGLPLDFPPLSAVLHPSLSSPFFSLHPCQTSAVMVVLQSTSSTPQSLDVLAWLSAIGPFVGFVLPFTTALHADLAKRRMSAESETHAVEAAQSREGVTET